MSSKVYEGEIRLPKGEKLEDGKFPNTLNMTLPDSYGQNAVMKLTLVDAENGIYKTTRGDRKFQISTDNGEITMKAVVTEELNNKLKTNLQNDEKEVTEANKQSKEQTVKFVEDPVKNLDNFTAKTLTFLQNVLNAQNIKFVETDIGDGKKQIKFTQNNNVYAFHFNSEGKCSWSSVTNSMGEKTQRNTLEA